MSGSIWADVLDELYDFTVAETFLAAEIAAERLYVYDGPIVTTFNGPTLMTIGALPLTEDESQTTSEWQWAALGRDGANADVDDAFSIPVGIHTILGANDMRTARRTAITVYAAFAAMVRNTTLGLPGVMWCIPQMASLTQSPTADGSECLITCAVHVRTRI
jgi:hypothetical protein